MTKSELISKLGDLEWEDFEVKEAKAEVPKSSWETVSAFANTNGGWLVFGIKQSGKSFEIQGINNPEKIEQDFLNALRVDKFNIPFSPKSVKYDFEGKTVLAFYITPSNKKPVYYNTQANSFIRRGSADHKASKEEIDAMYRDQAFGTKTSEIAKGTSRADINNASLSRYRDYMSRFNPSVSYNRYNEADFLQKLRIMDGEHCTLGGLLFLGNRDTIERFFPDFRIDLLEIPGTSYSDAKVRYTFRIEEYENLWEYYFECIARLKSKVDVKFQMGSEGFATDVSPGFDALREALVNMLMHADHFSPACPRIRIFTDHIEFYNPGGMPKPIEELKGKDISLPRNPIITKLFRVVKLAENAGFGLDNIEYNWNSYNQTKPQFDIDFDSVIVKFQLENELENQSAQPIVATDILGDNLGEKLEEIREEFGSISERILKSPEENKLFLKNNYGVFAEYLRSKFGVNSEKVRSKFGVNSEKVRTKFGLSSEHVNSNYNETTLAILMIITIEATITAKQIAEMLGIGSRAIEKQLAKLKNEKIITRIGSDKTGYWSIVFDDRVN